MADLTELQSAQTVKVVGTDSTGVEQYFSRVTPQGELETVDHLAADSFDKKVFLASSNVISVVGVGEVPFMLLKNPSGSAKTLRLFRIVFGTDTVNARTIFRFYLNPTITLNGTSLTPGCTFLGQATSAMEAYTSPTVTSNGTFLGVRFHPSATPATTVELDMEIIVSPNMNVLMTIDNTINNIPTHASAMWREIPV